ncbi:hypothetical protein INS49_007264 [Diaporthe citri]|uniref:uncharacterized protein n=1 Tax=Diaporthe citri TaxID=83186 RepID=UPI001C8272E3|nr:uncharacterized protein INS49_007264 [Diaporthe citri]KAG6365653.1 hypothetical protein INS49_007264 [Diaporthe citri]
MSPTAGVSDGDPSGSASNRITITESNLNPVLQILTWLLLAFTTLVLSFRLFTNIIVKGRMPVSLEDLLFLSAFIFSVAESVTVVIPASNVLGKDISEINRSDLVGGLKAEYARDILFVLSLAMAKLSACQNIFILSPNDTPRLLARIIAWITGSWMVVCVLATAFQCGTQGPWTQEDSHCLNQHALYTFIIIPATICQIVYIQRRPDPNYTLHAFPYSICVQVVQFLSFFAVCVVYFWPFIKSLQSGLERFSDANMISD